MPFITFCYHFANNVCDYSTFSWSSERHFSIREFRQSDWFKEKSFYFSVPLHRRSIVLKFYQMRRIAVDPLHIIKDFLKNWREKFTRVEISIAVLFRSRPEWRFACNATRAGSEEGRLYHYWVYCEPNKRILHR